MATRETPSQRLATLVLGQPVNAWIAAQRAAGSSWRKIADDLSASTGGQVVVTHEAVRTWHEAEAA